MSDMYGRGPCKMTEKDCTLLTKKKPKETKKKRKHLKSMLRTSHNNIAVT